MSRSLSWTTLLPTTEGKDVREEVERRKTKGVVEKQEKAEQEALISELSIPCLSHLHPLPSPLMLSTHLPVPMVCHSDQCIPKN